MGLKHVGGIGHRDRLDGLKRMGFPFGIETWQYGDQHQHHLRGLKRMGFPFGIETWPFEQSAWR